SVHGGVLRKVGSSLDVGMVVRRFSESMIFGSGSPDNASERRTANGIVARFFPLMARVRISSVTFPPLDPSRFRGGNLDHPCEGAECESYSVVLDGWVLHRIARPR